MPQSTPTLTLESAREIIRERSFPRSTGSRVGVELEWFTTPSSDPPDVPTLERILSTAMPLPYGSALTFEPGGQVEVSSPPFGTCAEACAAAAGDTHALRERLVANGIALFASGLDAQRPLRLLTDVPRYVAMRKYFDAYGVAGGRMMCATAAIHTNLDAGNDDEGRDRWRAAHMIGPTLLAAFANSPIVDGAPSGWMSTRFASWLAIDPSRTSAVQVDGDPAGEWASYALEARVMFVRGEETYRPLQESVTFAEWIEHGGPDGFPDADDLVYHLTTLFPPVRPHGWLEIRTIDMLPDPWWRVAVAVTTALVCDADARRRALDACAGTATEWNIAARRALEDQLLRASAQECFAAARSALTRIGCDGSTEALMDDYIERFVSVGRCPADEQLDSYRTKTVEAI